jgi:hypothetical protein
MYVRLYVYMYLCMCVCMHVYIDIYLCLCMCMYVCVGLKSLVVAAISFYKFSATSSLLVFYMF